MDVSLLDTDKALNENYKSIIDFIIEAVNDYPIINLSDLNVYLEEVKKELNSEIISIDTISWYLSNRPFLAVQQIWINESLASFREALKLISFYKLDFSDVVAEMQRLQAEQ
jgi:hypothetical protein